MFVKIYHNALVTLHMTGVLNALFYYTFCSKLKIFADCIAV